MHSRKFLGLAIALCLVAPPGAQAFTLNGSTVVEDFTTDDFADYAGSTGVWNSLDHAAQAGVVANNVASRQLLFGDGSDGTLTWTAGQLVFDTNARPNGFNYKSINITGGTIKVTGTHPLVLRSLGKATITPTISAMGVSPPTPDGTANASTTGPAGTSAVTCSANGGAGGGATVNNGSDGSDGFKSDGTSEGGVCGVTGSCGPLQTGGAYNGSVEASTPTTGPASNDFDTASNLVCGTGGGGGGGYSDGAGLPLGTYATGGAGGAGGGVVHITALGDLSVGTILASGTDGGNGIDVAAGPCSGNGSGGNGGAIWLQTPKALSTGVDPKADGGNSGMSTCNNTPTQSLAGYLRGDSSAVGTRPAWAAGAGNFDTANTAPATTYVVLSKAYDLGTLNAAFPSQASISSTANGGSVAVTFAGSTDGTSFSDFASSLTSLSNQGFRYVKFKITLQTAAVAGSSPTVSQISFNYNDAGLDRLDLKISPGCGSLASMDGSDRGGHGGHAPPLAVARFLLGWLAFWMAAYGAFRYWFVRTAWRAGV